VYGETKYSSRSINIFDHPMVFYGFVIITFTFPFVPKILTNIPTTFAGFNFTGWAWIIMFFYSLLVIIFRSNKISYYPLAFFPWILYIVTYSLFQPSFLGVQLTLQYIAMFLTGMAASTFHYSFPLLKRIFKFFIGMTLLFILLYLIIPELDQLSAVLVMNFTFVGILLLSIYFIKKNLISLLLYLVLVYIAYVAVTRMAILILLIIPPLHFFPYNIIKRFLIMGMMAFFGLILFQTETIQQKSFFTGTGSLYDISYQNTNFRSSGRSYFYELLEEDLDKNPLFGQGPRADLIKFKKNELEITEAHNDFLSVRYNYGWIGLILLIQGFIFQIFALFRKKQYLNTPAQKIIFYTALTAFIAWIGFMSTDNILKYSTYFGNFHFCAIAIIYSLSYKREPQKKVISLPRFTSVNLAAYNTKNNWEHEV
jgi:hypothetical protein